VCEKGFLALLVMEKPEEKIENQKVCSREKTRKMRTIRLRFRSSHSKDRIIIAKFVSKHGHPGLGEISPGDASTELPHVGHHGEIFDGLTGRNKFMQQDGNHGPFINQDTIRQELSKIVQGYVLFFHPQFLRRPTTEPNNVFHNVRDIDPFLSKMVEDPSAL
jgi:hypothetical protein